jgi:uncharacterized protein (DUF58 family)
MMAVQEVRLTGDHQPTPEALLKALKLGMRRPVAALAPGDYRSIFSGIGTELIRLRPYGPGDDVRLIDPSATARRAEPHIRVYVAEKTLTTWIALDVSPSMTFGTADRRKANVVEGIALILGHLSARGGNSIGAATFGDRNPQTLLPRGGRDGTCGLLKLLQRRPDSKEVGTTSPAEVLTRIARLARQHALVVVASDFRGPRNWRGAMLRLASRHETIAIEVQDPREQELPDVGDLFLIDPETGRQLRVDTSDRRLRERFAAAAAAERTELAAEFRSLGVDHLVLSTSGDWLREFASFLSERVAVRRGRT